MTDKAHLWYASELHSVAVELNIVSIKVLPSIRQAREEEGTFKVSVQGENEWGSAI